MAMNWDILKALYLQASRAGQMDSLSLNLIRLQALADSGTAESVAHHLVRESQFFIEWTVPDIHLESEMSFVTELLDLQRLLSRWKLSWPALWSSEPGRQEIAKMAQHWCDRLQGQQQLLAS